ncbi:hypothetical protein K4K59_003808 [Colletotrichum sp. SAR11_240]|nr:hypothetical protein K4K59_003808 [Colletotrichum sp. SAR11_240]
MSAADIDPAQRLKDRKPIPKPVPAYLATAGSPLTVDKVLYESAQKAPRILVEEFTSPIRSGKAWKAPAGSIVRISTPEGPQVAEQDVLMALSTCPGGDLSLWGFGEDSEEEMIKCCRPLKVEVFKIEDEGLLQRGGWKPAEVSPYKGRHGMNIPLGENAG